MNEFYLALLTDVALAFLLLVMFAYVAKMSNGVRGIAAWGIGHFIFTVGAVMIDGTYTELAPDHSELFAQALLAIGTPLANIGLVIAAYAVISFVNERTPNKYELAWLVLMFLVLPVCWLQGINLISSAQILSISELMFLAATVVQLTKLRRPPAQLPAFLMLITCLPLMYTYGKDFLDTVNNSYQTSYSWVQFDLAAWFLLNFGMLMMTSFKAAEHLRIVAARDPLTGVLNRRGMSESLALQFPHNQKANSAVIALDLDHFKQVNDAFGHDVGDQVLRLFSHTVSSQIRKSDIFARTGGEEFLIIMQGDDADHAKVLAERIREAVAKMHLTHRGLPKVTVSVGVHCSTTPMDIKQQIKEADRALYQAKNNGRDSVVAFCASTRPA